jgi:hypothetical protein
MTHSEEFPDPKDRKRANQFGLSTTEGEVTLTTSGVPPGPRAMTRDAILMNGGVDLSIFPPLFMTLREIAMP